ncbi:MAG: GxxExxY protein [Desulfobulbia bacterium]
MKKENELSKIIIACALEAHRTLGGPGLLESIYEEALVYELGQQRVEVQRQVLLPVNYKGKLFGNSLRIDLLVDNLVIVESKATTQYHPVFESQLLTYLRVSGLKLGLVINFGEILLKNGIHRVVNGL